MENKGLKAVRLSTVILLFIILILVIALASMYVYYNSSNSNKVSDNNSQASNSDKLLSNTNNETQNTTSQASHKKLDINNSMVKELYNYIPAEVEYKAELSSSISVRMLNAYQSKKVTIDDLDDELVLGHAYLNTEIPLSERMLYEDGNTDIPVTSWYKAAPDRLQETILKMYNAKIEDKSFYLDFNYGTYENGIYTFTAGGGGNSFDGFVQNIEEAYEEDNELYIIDSYLYYSDTYEQNKHLFKVYDSSNDDNLILTDSVNDSEVSVSTDGSTGTFDNTDNYVKEHYWTKAPKYKHTFKKNNDGKYYWFSSEPYEK